MDFYRKCIEGFKTAISNLKKQETEDKGEVNKQEETLKSEIDSLERKIEIANINLQEKSPMKSIIRSEKDELSKQLKDKEKELELILSERRTIRDNTKRAIEDNRAALKDYEEKLQKIEKMDRYPYPKGFLYLPWVIREGDEIKEDIDTINFITSRGLIQPYISSGLTSKVITSIYTAPNRLVVGLIPTYRNFSYEKIGDEERVKYPLSIYPFLMGDTNRVQIYFIYQPEAWKGEEEDIIKKRTEEIEAYCFDLHALSDIGDTIANIGNIKARVIYNLNKVTLEGCTLSPKSPERKSSKSPERKFPKSPERKSPKTDQTSKKSSTRRT